MGRIMLIRNAEIWKMGRADIRVEDGRISAIGSLSAMGSEAVCDANGGALLPGLHDHHIHLAATAVGRRSVQCGPPEVVSEAQLAAALSAPGEGWLRGIGYHESVAGMLDAALIDAWVRDRPVRIQHRSGRMWFLNSAALEVCLTNAAPSPGLEKSGGKWTGRLFDDDPWLRVAAPQSPPDFTAVSRELARCGITGITDMSAANVPSSASEFDRQIAAGHLLQKTMMAGTLGLAEAHFGSHLILGPAKLHLHEWALPPLEEAVSFIRKAHGQGRAIASHCTTEVELVFTLAALREGGVISGDRIEHGGVVPDHLLADIAELGLHVISQPHFIAERGDQYLADVEPRDHALLYRLAAFNRAGVVLAGGSDAPYGSIDPWAAMRAAVSRKTASGVTIGKNESLTPEEALALYLADPQDLPRQRSIEIGSKADLCMLDLPWKEARERLSSDDVRMTIIDGSIVHDCVNQTPI